LARLRRRQHFEEGSEAELAGREALEQLEHADALAEDFALIGAFPGELVELGLLGRVARRGRQAGHLSARAGWASRHSGTAAR
jgi:hypothetical protein